MGVLYARVSGQWVPVAVGGSVIPPAYAGPRRVAGAATDAFFSTLAAGANDTGYAVRDGLAFVQLEDNALFAVYSATGGQLMTVAKTVGLNVLGARLGQFPGQTGYPALWRDTANGPGQYAVLLGPDGTDNYFNAASHLHLRVNNVDKMSLTAGGCSIANATTVYSFVWSEFDLSGSGGWSNANFVARGLGNQGRVAIHAPGYAPQWRTYTGEGEQMAAVNLDNTVYRPIGASAFNVVSSRDIKRSIRPLRPGLPEHITVRRDPMSDVVEPLDIMDLRPVVFRPQALPTKLGGEDGMEVIPEDDPILFLEETKERVGLIAEEVAEVIPSAVRHRTDGSAFGIDYAQITVALLDHVQRLTEEVTALRTRVSELEGSTT